MSEGELKKRFYNAKNLGETSQGFATITYSDFEMLLDAAKIDFPLTQIQMDSIDQNGKSTKEWIEKSYFDKIPRITVGEWFKKWFGDAP